MERERDITQGLRPRQHSPLPSLSDLVGLEQEGNGSERGQPHNYGETYAADITKKKKMGNKKYPSSVRSLVCLENIVETLFCRECGLVNAFYGDHRFFRTVYRAMVPKGGATLDVKLPNVIIRRFTPDGKYLVCFSQNQKDLVLYRLVNRRVSRNTTC